MELIEARNVQDALIIGRQMMEQEAETDTSRFGEVYVMPVPVTTWYKHPTERVLFYPERDANPFFHFMEGLWMISGRNDVEWISHYTKGLEQFSDDGVTFHGAYGYRWRSHFDFDQLDLIISLLQNNPKERRIVLQMWDPTVDIARAGKDFPCNTNIYFRVNGEELDMTVCNRSNDMIWGAYGANAVHMSMLQEYIASCLGRKCGFYYQISNNFHAYAATWDKSNVKPMECPYTTGEVNPFPMMNTNRDQWDQELKMFMNDGPNVMGYKDRFFKRVAVPMAVAWNHWKEKDIDKAIKACSSIEATDWRKACTEWLQRRAK